MATQIQVMAQRLNVDPTEMHNIVLQTVMPNKGSNVTNEQFVSFLAVANEYKLNPLTKEVYAFPAKGGGIQPIVSVDGWLKIINNHPQFDGMEFQDSMEGTELISVTCRIYRKDRSKPTEVTEYMAECKMGTDTWRKYPARMLRHKATIQAARYAFGLSGIIDPDEADRFEQAGAITRPAEQPVSTGPTYYSAQDFNAKFEQWAGLIQSGKKTPNDLINLVESKGKLFTDEQKMKLAECQIIEADYYTEEIA
jgi:phage recombination protein Bet